MGEVQNTQWHYSDTSDIKLPSDERYRQIQLPACLQGKHLHTTIDNRDLGQGNCCGAGDRGYFCMVPIIDESRGRGNCSHKVAFWKHWLNGVVPSFYCPSLAQPSNTPLLERAGPKQISLATEQAGKMLPFLSAWKITLSGPLFHKTAIVETVLGKHVAFGVFMLHLFPGFLLLQMLANLFLESRPTSALMLKFSRMMKLLRGKGAPCTTGAEIFTGSPLRKFLQLWVLKWE